MNIILCPNRAEAIAQATTTNVALAAESPTKTLAVSRDSHRALLVQSGCSGSKREATAPPETFIVVIPLSITEAERKIATIRGG